MPHTGKDLAADLYELWKAGRDSLPSVAEQYSRASGDIADTDGRMDGAFRRPAYFGADGFGPVYSSWKRLRDQLQIVLADTSVNLREAAEALRMAVKQYAETDRDAKDELDHLKVSRGDPPLVWVDKPHYPPGHFPGPVMPAEGHWRNGAAPPPPNWRDGIDKVDGVHARWPTIT